MKKHILTLLLSFLTATSFVGCGNMPAKQEGDSSVQSTVSSDVVDSILNSYSAKAFKEGVVSAEVLQFILQSGQKAPSAMNLQPWHFTVIRDSEIASGLASRDYREGGVIIVVSGKSNERAGVNVAFDCALATQNMYIAAQSLGLGAHLYFGGVKNINDTTRDKLGIPDGYEAQIYMLVGQLDDGVDATSSASLRNPLTDNVNYVD